MTLTLCCAVKNVKISIHEYTMKTERKKEGEKFLTAYNLEECMIVVPFTIALFRLL